MEKEYDEIQDLAVEADADGTGFSVDFDELLAINSDTIAWIRFDEPSIINYPVVKSADNEEYLTKTFAENDNKLGAIFMDMRNNSDFSDRNTIIYGHHLNVSPDMFSRLNMYEDEEFCKEHPDFYIYTPDGRSVHTLCLRQVRSVRSQKIMLWILRRLRNMKRFLENAVPIQRIRWMWS